MIVFKVIREGEEIARIAPPMGQFNAEEDEAVLLAWAVKTAKFNFDDSVEVEIANGW